MAEDLGRSLEQLTATIQEQNKELKRKDSLDELDKSITALEKSGTENSAQLRQTLTNIQIALDSSSNAEQMELAEEQLEALKDLAGTEEENREAARRQEEANEFLSKIVSGIDGLADQYDKMLDNLKPSAGLVAGLGAAALLFMDPETLFAGVQAAIDGVFAIVDSIKMFLEGDFTGGFELLKENIGAVGAIVGTFAVLFGGTIIRTIGSMVKAFSSLTKVIGKLFLPFTIITGLISFVTGFMKGYEDGGILGGIEAGLKSAFDTLIAWPLDLIKDAVAFVLGKLGFEDAKATLEAFSFSEQIDKIFTAIFDVVEKAVAWVKGLFTDPIATLTNLWNGIAAGFTSIANWIHDTALKPAFEWINGLFTWASDGLAAGWTTLTDYISKKWTAVKTWFTDLWAWASEGIAQGWTNVTDFVSGKWSEVKTWFTEKLTWASDLATEGWTNLKDFVSGLWTSVETWVTEKLTWASDGIAAGWTNLTDYISGKWNEVHTWITGLFDWASDGISGTWTNLTDFVSGKWTATKTWFEDMFTWSSGEDDKGIIQKLFDSTIEKVTTFFTDLFDFLPSFEEIKASLTSILPDWMKPDTIEEQRSAIEEEIAAARAAQSNAPKESEINFIQDGYTTTQEEYAATIEQLEKQLADLNGLNRGGIVKAPETGGLAVLHGTEIVAPLDSPQGQVLMAINDLMNNKAQAGAGEYGGMGGPMIVQGGSNQTSNNTNNVSNANYTIQQGITPDDFLKRDFLNFSY
jgi:hypothetical protein